MLYNHRMSVAVVVSFCLAGVLQACGEENDTPDPDVIPGLGGETNTGGADSSSGGGSPLGGSDQGLGGNQATGGGLGETPDREDCPEEPNGEDEELGDCWDLAECNGQSEGQFLNQCAGSKTCIGAFDNEARIEGYSGQLPPL